MISVIIPVYNVEKYVENCLNSLENQTYKKFEVILIDDGSKDESVKICERYKNKSKLDIKIVRQTNQGVSAARNKGINVAKGDYVCFIDSDDMVSNNYLEVLKKLIEKEDSDISICGIKNISEDEKSNNINLEINAKSYTINDKNEILEKFLKREINPGVWCIMIKLDLLKKNNIYFTVGARYSEDIEFLYKIFSISQKISITKEKKYFYRERNSSVMSKVDDKRLDGYRLMKNLENYFEEQNIEFKKIFKKFGVARWVFATLWQICLASSDYKEFEKNSNYYDPKQNMTKLLYFPKIKIKIISLAYLINPKLYYFSIKLILKLFIKRKYN